MLKPSGLRINLDKTKVVWIGSKKGSNERFCKEYKLLWENNEFSVLGVKFTHDLSKISDVNYRIKMKEMKRIFTSWSERTLTPIGKIVVIKSLAIAKINHLMLALPDPSEKVLSDIQKIFYDYLWAKDPDKIKRSVIIQNYNEGDLRMIEVKTFLKSMKLTWLRRIVVNSTKYYLMIKELYPILEKCFRYGSRVFDEEKNTINNKFWLNVLYCFKCFSESLMPSNWSECLNVPIWYNTYIKVGGTAVCYQHWIEKGILFINDLLDRNGLYIFSSIC